MPTPRFSIRVDPATLDSWKKAAKKEGLSVSALIHQRMTPQIEPRDLKAGSLGTNGGPDDGDSEAAVVPAPRRDLPASTSTVRKPTSVPCKHPKGARQPLNPDLGLSRCGACGDTLRR